MSLEYTFSWFVGTLCLALAVTAVLMIRQKQRLAALQEGPEPEVSGERLAIKLSIPEMPVVRTLIGSTIAEKLTAHLLKQLACDLDLTESPIAVGDDIIISLAANDGIERCELVEQVRSIVARPVYVEGIEFCFNAEVRILTINRSEDAYSDHRLRQTSAAAISASAFETSQFTSDCIQSNNLQLLKEFAVAMAEDRIFLAYQPKLDLRHNSIDSVEALLRWKRKDGELVNTGELIDLLEKTGTIKPLTKWVAKQAATDSAKLSQAGHEITTYINVSGGLLADRLFANMLLETASQSNANIGIEITETAVIADPEVAIANLHAIAQAGVHIAIDDFGAGLSSLEYLQRLPASELKIDRNFIAKLSSSNRNPLIVKATIDLAHALEMRVTAEGVDDPLSLALLRVMGCDMAQGFLVSSPLTLDDLVGFLGVYRDSNIDAPAQTAHPDQPPGPMKASF